MLSRQLEAVVCLLRSVLPPDYFKALAAEKPSFIVRSEQIAGRLSVRPDWVMAKPLAGRSVDQTRFDQRQA